MKIDRVIRLLENSKHIRDLSIRALIADTSLYEPILVSLDGITFIHPCNDKSLTIVKISEDLNAFRCMLVAENSIMLPCRDCMREQPFKMRFASRNILNDSSDEYKRYYNEGSRNISPTSISSISTEKMPVFRMESSILSEMSYDASSHLKNMGRYDEYVQACIKTCESYLMNNVTDIKFHAKCSLESRHIITAHFVLIKATDLLPDEDKPLINKYLEDNIITEPQCRELCSTMVLMKTGQYPSLADLQLFDVAKYRRILGNDKYSDLTRAIGLYAHGIGCGSFLYLRRILEYLVEKEHQASCNLPEWDEEKYKTSRFDEKLQMLEALGRGIIPTELNHVKHKIYSVLSLGVHESTDDDCKDIFQAVLYTIEIILDEEIAKKEKEKKIKNLTAVFGN